LLNFYRPYPTSVVGANFYGCFICDPSLEKNIKNSEKIKKSLISTGAFWEKSKSGKRKNMHYVLCFTLLRYI